MAKIKNFFIRTGIVLAGLVVIFLIGHTILNIYASRKIKDEINKIKENGEPLNLQDLTQELIPEEENAATIYNKVFSLLDTYRTELDKVEMIKSYTDISKWTEEEKRDIPDILEKHNGIFDLLHNAALKERCNFNLDYSMGFNLPLPHLAKLRDCARLLLVKATLDMENGDTDKAIEKIIDGFAVARASRNDNILISELVRIGCNTIMLGGLGDLIKDKDIPYISYQKLYNLLRKERQAKIITFVGERCVMKDLFDGILSGKMRAKDVIGGAVIIGACMPYDSTLRNLYIESYLHQPFLKLDCVYCLDMFGKGIELAKRPYWEIKNKSIFFKKEIPKIYFCSRMYLPPFSRTLQQGSIVGAQLGSAEIAMALRIYKTKHGNYPSSLNELIPEIIEELPKDPFTGKDFIYKRKGEGFIVYSLGDNCKDDGGNWDKPRKWDGDFDIVFEMVR